MRPSTDGQKQVHGCLLTSLLHCQALQKVNVYTDYRQNPTKLANLKTHKERGGGRKKKGLLYNKLARNNCNLNFLYLSELSQKLHNSEQQENAKHKTNKRMENEAIGQS
uniref:Uncharacterized protein n=1 Tax=Opuntia streptacantha TaxID=393608 RepID=A0A7C9ANX0_OPUST